MQEQERNFTTEELKTDAGKELAVYKIANSSLYKVAFTSGGQLPTELDGMWTNPVMAQKSIKAYLAKRKNISAKEETVFKQEVAPSDVPKNTVSKKKTSAKKKTA